MRCTELETKYEKAREAEERVDDLTTVWSYRNTIRTRGDYSNYADVHS